VTGQPVPDRPAHEYLHGSEASEQSRLESQAKILGVAEHLPELRPGMRLLDVGCGTGAVAREVAKQVAPGEVVGIDREEAQLAVARQMAVDQSIENVTFVEGDAINLPSPGASFDGVYSSMFLEHVSNPVQVASEMRRVAAFGGWVCLFEWETGSWTLYPEFPAIRHVWKAVYGLQARQGGDPKIGRKLYSAFVRAGLSDVTVRGSTLTITASQPDSLRRYVAGASEIIRQARPGMLSGGMVTEDVLEQAKTEYDQLLASPDAFVFHGFCCATSINR
jgi:ubiquinone/menaquinone biosynthesis C-methylase UbiE|tara:strand:- start:464 stop:1294 length:831 start_codon:yes stop_codon:yes gene_type:complete